MDGGGCGVLNTCCVGQKIANSDGVVGYAETGRVWTDIRCDVLVTKLRQILLDGIAQREFSFFGQHHNADRGGGLRHGHDLEDGVLLHGTASFDVRHAESVEFDDVGAMGDYCDGAGDGLFIDEVLYPLRDLREDRVVHACGVGRLAPR